MGADDACRLLFCAAKRSGAFPSDMPAGLMARVSRLSGFISKSHRNCIAVLTKLHRGLIGTVYRGCIGAVSELPLGLLPGLLSGLSSGLYRYRGCDIAESRPTSLV
jgi:hypothetical protein